MPQVPAYKNQTHFSTSSGEVLENNIVQDESLRLKLADEVKQQVSDKKMITTDFLDSFVATHLSTQETNTPVAWDYVALRQTAQCEMQQATQQQRTEALVQEGNWIKQVGTATTDADSLQAYLSLQLPIYQKKLEQSGLSVDRAQKTASQLQAKTVEQHILRSLSGGNCQMAQQVLSSCQKQLPQAVYERCSQQVRQTFSRQTGNQLWETAWQETDGQIEQTYALALEKLEEPDEDLRMQIKNQLKSLSEKASLQKVQAQADLFSRLAQLNNLDQVQLLSSQQEISGDTLARAQQASQSANIPATPAQQTWFVKNYFSETLDADKAFDKGQCAPRDYFCLQAAKQGRCRGGKSAQDETWLCQGIRTFMHKQGFGEKEISQALYTVLSETTDNAVRQQRWKQIKTLLTC